MKTVNLEKLQAEAKERHKHKIRKPYTKKEKQYEPPLALLITWEKPKHNSIQYP